MVTLLHTTESLLPLDTNSKSIIEFPNALEVLHNFLDTELRRQNLRGGALAVVVQMLGVFPLLPLEIVGQYPISRLQELIKALPRDRVDTRGILKFIKLFDYGKSSARYVGYHSREA